MKYIKYGFLVTLFLVIALCLQGCTEYDNSKGERDKSGSQISSQERISQIGVVAGEEKDLYICDNEVTFLHGKITDFANNEDSTGVAYVIEGQLYLNLGGRAKKVGPCQKIFKVSAFGNAVAYSDSPREIKIFSFKNEKTTTYPIVCEAEDVDALTIAPDGSAFAYTSDTMADIYLCRKGESMILTQRDSIGCISHVSPNGEQVYAESKNYRSLECFTPNGGRSVVWSDDVNESEFQTYYFNQDYTQVLLQQNRKTYICVNGATPVLFYDGLVEPMMDDCEDFYGSLFTGRDGSVMRIEQNADKNCILLTADDVADRSAKIDRTGKYITYRSHTFSWNYLPINAKASTSSQVVFCLDPYDYAQMVYFAKDMSFAYFVMHDMLYYGDASGFKVVSKLSEDAAWGGMVHLTDKGKGVYYSTEDALYYYDGENSTLVDDHAYSMPDYDTHIVRREDNRAYYLIRENHTLELIPGEFE